MSADVVALHNADRPRYQPTDIGNAERLIALHGHDIRYVDVLGGWHVFDGRRWVRDETRQVERYAKNTVRSIYDEARSTMDDQYRMLLVKHGVASEAAARIVAMIQMAQAEPGITIRQSDLDRDPFLLNVANGTLDLHTMELREHRREDLMTKIASVMYDPEATCPTWLAFLNRIFAGDAELIEFVKRFVGYALTGDVREQIFLLFYGTGANGKSTFLETLGALLGDYAMQSAFDTFISKQTSSGPRDDVARLAGSRLVRAAENEEGKRLDESLIKALTGGEKITARHLWARYFEFAPTFKVVLSGNHKPVVRGSDHGLWRRVRLVPFVVTSPEEERDPQLPQKLLAELPGILNWALSGLGEWWEKGLGMPSAVKAATESYREDSDTIGRFIEDKCLVGPGRKCVVGPLYKAYQEWAEAEGLHAVSQVRFGRAFDERGFEKEKSGGVVTRFGLSLKA